MGITAIKHWKVRFFPTARGDYPVVEFIKKQNQTTYAKILHSIELLKNNGPFLTLPYSKKLQPGIYELRILGKEAIRILYSSNKGEYFLLHAFKKKSQKIPHRDLRLGLDRMKELI